MDQESQVRLADYIERVNPRFRMYPHCKAIVEALEAVYHRDVENLMVWIPPGTGKSELISRLYASYVPFTRPRNQVGIVSYGAALAQEMTRDARDYYLDAGGKLDPSQRAKTRWKSLQGGGLWGTGFGGAVRGNRYHDGIVDDPHKGPEELLSEIKRERVYRWWDQTWMNRGHLYSDRAISRIIVMQRVGEGDLCDWLLKRPDSDKWTVLALDAVRDEETPFDVGDAHLLPDWRRHGEFLCPERLSAEVLAEVTQDPFVNAAQYQQRPKPTSGTILDHRWFRIVQPFQVPMMMRRVIGMDLAVSTRQTADYTVAICLGYGVDGRYYIWRPFRERMETPDSRDHVVAYARQHRCQVIGVESVAFQLSYVQELKRHPAIAGIAVKEFDVDRDKVSRARGWSHHPFTGMCYLVDDGSGWYETFLDEVRDFPRGKHDDQIDALGVAFAMIRDLGVGGVGAITG